MTTIRKYLASIIDIRKGTVADAGFEQNQTVAQTGGRMETAWTPVTRQ